MAGDSSGVLREIAIYVLWLVLVFAVGAVVFFSVATFVFGTRRVPPELFFAIATAAVVVVTYVRAGAQGLSFKDMGLHFDRRLPVLVCAGFILAVGALGLFWVTARWLGVADTASGTGFPSIWAYVTALIYIFGQSATEEFIFRGYLFRLSLRRGLAFAVIGTSLAFSVVHVVQGLNIVGLVNIFLVGVVAALMIHSTGSLWPAIGFHAGWNHVQLHVLGFPMYGARDTALLRSVIAEGSILGGGSYGPEGGLICTLILAALVFWMLRRMGQGLGEDELGEDPGALP